MKHVILSALLALASLAGGCSSAALFRAPDGFVAIDDDAYDQRATNADGVVIAVRALDNDPRGDLSFWSGVIDRRLRERYQAVDVREVEAEAGTPGVQIRYETVHSGRVQRYWATIFVQGDRVFLIEAGGDAELFDPHAAEVEVAVLSVNLS